MNNMNEHDYEQLKLLIERLVENKVYDIINNLGVESVSSGKVVAIDSTQTDADGVTSEVIRASVELADGNIIPNLFNASGEILAIGDNVKIYGSRTNLSNRYIGIKYEREVVLP